MSAFVSGAGHAVHARVQAAAVAASQRHGVAGQRAVASSASRARMCMQKVEQEKPDASAAAANGVKVTVEKVKVSQSSAATTGCVVAVGLSHHTATVSVREKLSIPEAEWLEVGAEMCTLPFVKEAAVLSTCNRFEVYLVAEGDMAPAAILHVCKFLSKRSGVPVRELREYLFMLSAEEAIWHLLRVSAGLDSLVIGEGQILAQVKKCYQIATEKKGGAGKVLNKLLNIAVSAGKRVRSETQIAKGAVSISSAAVELAELKCDGDVLKMIQDCRICILGAGKMSRLLVQHLTSRNVQHIAVVNRSRERMDELQKMFPDFELELLGMESMLDAVSKADITFASTGAEEPILFEDNLRPVLDGNRAMLIDISVPRNVAEDVGNIDGVNAYNVDDLKAVVARNQSRRRRLLLEAEKLLEQERADFNNWHHSLGSVPTITKLQERAETIRQEELDKMSGKLSALTDAERAAVEKLTRGIVSKMIHGPMAQLRGTQDVEERANLLRSLESMFSL
ncbi:Glutamyl-tRNA reductase [Porphyridium purpureum]|uniref:Glutamyl-tRNA reductase n=1 Tax=Porphyridium purpureum TaxID=35688 RepID=A0A5J4Z6S0_PORPP|nr:Glutamyl-tRNA reductase [Porphyridium purpureum]|eukprot:POR9529..scf295_1